MSGGKKLVSALLALAMVGQMGIFVGMADDSADKFTWVDPSSDCFADHGMDKDNHHVTDLNSNYCQNPVHWLSCDKDLSLIGGNGTNYFYPPDVTEGKEVKIACKDNAKDIIIIESMKGGGKLTISTFSAEDKIILPDDAKIKTEKVLPDPNKDPDGEHKDQLFWGDVTITFDNYSYTISLVDSAYEGENPAGNMPAGEFNLSITPINVESNSEVVTINTTRANGNDDYNYKGVYNFLWESKDNPPVYTAIPESGTSNSGTCSVKTSTLPSSTGTYNCIVIEKDTGNIFKKNDVLTIEEKMPEVCSATPQSISINATDTDGYVLNGNLELKAGDTKTFNLDAEVKYDDKCNLSTHTNNPSSNHDYTITWGVKDDPKGVSIQGNSKMVIAAEAPSQTVTLTAKVEKNGSSPLTPAELTFTVQRTTVPPEDTEPDPDPKNNLTLEITGEDGSSAPVSQINISSVSKEDTVSYSYSAKVSAESGYTINWQLTGQPGGVSLSSQTGETVQLTVTKAGLMEAFRDAGITEKTFTLTATADDPDTLTKSLKITVSADCTMIPTEVKIGNAPKDFYIRASETQTVSLSCTVTWKGKCANKSHNHGQTAIWSVEENPNGWASGVDANGKLTLSIGASDDKEAGTSAAVKVKASVTADNGSADAEAVITVTKADSNIQLKNADSLQDKFTITSASAATVSSSYTAVISGDDEEQTDYDFFWTLTPTADYISVSAAENAATATVTIHKDKLPSAGVNNKVFVLTVTAVPKATSQQTTLMNPLTLTAPLNSPIATIAAPTPKVLRYEITVHADAKSSSSGSSGGSSGSGGSGGSGSGSSSSSSSDSSSDSDWYQWQDVRWDIEDAKKGSTVKASLGSNTDMPFTIFDALRGQDVNLQMKISGGYTWTVNGKTIRTLPGNQIWVSMGVESYSNSKMTALCRDSKIKSFQLENTGSFYGDMRLTMSLGSGYAKKTVYLYSYNETTNKLTYASSAKVADNGNVDFTFTRSLGAYVITSKALYGESAVSTGGGLVGSGNNPTVVYPPVVSIPDSNQGSASSQAPAPSGESSPESQPESIPEKPSPVPDTAPADTEPEPGSSSFPIVVPLLILSIAGVITATVVVIGSSKNRPGFGIA